MVIDPNIDLAAEVLRLRLAVEELEDIEMVPAIHHEAVVERIEAEVLRLREALRELVAAVAALQAARSAHMLAVKNQHYRGEGSGTDDVGKAAGALALAGNRVDDALKAAESALAPTDPTP